MSAVDHSQQDEASSRGEWRQHSTYSQAMSDADGMGGSTRRRSSLSMVASSVRASVVSAVSIVEEQIEVGTVGGTVLNTTCNVIGAGVLALPLAAHHCGLAWAVILTVGMACVGAFSAYIIFVGCDRAGVYFLNELFAIAVVGRPPRSDDDHAGELDDEERGSDLYGATGTAEEPKTKAAAGTEVETGATSGKREDKRRTHRRILLSMLVDVLVMLNNFGLLVVYARIIIDSIPPVMSQFLKADGVWTSDWFWCVLPAAIFFALTSVRNMAELKWSSILGIATIEFAVVAVIVRFAQDGYQGGGERQLRVWEITGAFPATLATLSVAFTYHFNAPIFYHELQERTPRKMMKTVAISYPIIAGTYILIGVFGYLSFGAHVADKSAGGDIVNNYADDDVLMNCVRLALFFHFLSVYPVMSVCVRHSLHRFILTAMGRREEAIHPDMPARVSRAAIVAEAFSIVAASALIACFYKNVGQMIEYVGSICGATLMLTVPGIIGMCIWQRGDDDEGGAAPLVATDESTKLVDKSRLELPPFHGQRRLMNVLCGVLTLFGVAASLASFASTTLRS